MNCLKYELTVRKIRNMEITLTGDVSPQSYIQKVFQTFFCLKSLRTAILICSVAKDLKIDRNPGV